MPATTDLRLVKRGDATVQHVDIALTTEVSVVNEGPGVVTDLVLTDTLPPGTTANITRVESAG